jgi:3',5'-cyclic AMP phosphodiesterase CpdA
LKASATTVLRIAHVSDLHVLAPLGVELRRVLFNKRVTGYANLLMKRARVYRREYLLSVLAAAAAEADQLVVTGDITNLSLEGEYAEARHLLDEIARTTEVTVVPGNHDIYLPAVLRERRFLHHFDPFMRSDLPGLAVDLPAGRFPIVKLRGPAAIIGLTSAVPRPPFVSAGFLGHDQLAALAQILEHPEVARRTAVVLVHHSPFDYRFRLEQLRGGLVDARSLRETLSPLAHGLVLYGHLHVRRRARLATRSGAVEALCATAAALDHPDARVRAGCNLYQLEDDGRIDRIEARVLAPSTHRFETMALPRADLRVGAA